MTLENLLSLLNSLAATPELLAEASLAMATIAAFFATLACLRLRRTSHSTALTKFEVMELLRGEADTLKSDGDERERRMVTGLANTFIERTREFSAKFDRLATQIDGRAEIVWDKFKSDMAQLGTEANQNRDSLRRLVEEELVDSTSKQAAIARELRDELSAGFQNLKRNVSSTHEYASDQQKERLDDVKRALERNIEQQGKAQEALRMAIESRLDAIRLESSSKLEDMRMTFDEKLHKALETRLHQSFTRIGEQLSKVYDQIGEMKILASSSNGHSPFPANLNGAKENGIKETFAP